MKRSPHTPRRAVIVPLVALCMLALVAFCALAIDLGVVAVARSQAQTAADASALAGARVLDGSATNNLGAADPSARAAAGRNTMVGGSINSATQVTVRAGAFVYDTTNQVFKPDFVNSAGNPWTLVQANVGFTPPNDDGSATAQPGLISRPLFFAKIFGSNTYNTGASAMAVHKPRDLAMVLDYTGSMSFGSHLGDTDPNWGGRWVCNNPDPVYPKFGHYAQLVGRTTDNTGNALNEFAMRRDANSAIIESDGQTRGAANFTCQSPGGPPMVANFYRGPNSDPANLQPAWARNDPALSPAAWLATASLWTTTSTVGPLPAPGDVSASGSNSFEDQSDANYLGDRALKQTKNGGTSFARTLSEIYTAAGDYTTGTMGTNSGRVNAWEGNGTALTSAGDAAGTSNVGYCSNSLSNRQTSMFGYGMGPGYYGKTFWQWPPDPRPAWDWRQRFFVIRRTDTGAVVSGRTVGNNPMTGSTQFFDNSVMWDSAGNMRTPGTTVGIVLPGGTGTVNCRYEINYPAILNWILGTSSGTNASMVPNGPIIFTDTLRSGRCVYYNSLPSPTSGWFQTQATTQQTTAYTFPPAWSSATLDEIYWINYINYVLGFSQSSGGAYNDYSGGSLYGGDFSWGTAIGTNFVYSRPQITASTASNYFDPQGDGNSSNNLNAIGGSYAWPNSREPYMDYRDNPERPRLRFWFGAIAMMDMMNDQVILPGTCYQAQCWQLKAGVSSALDDIALNHPNDFVSVSYFSDKFASGQGIMPRSQVNGTGSTMNRNFQQMKNALYYPFQFVLPWGNVDMATNPGTNEIRPYNSSFNNSSAADVPRADGSTNPSTGFRLAYNTLSGANGNTARRGASKVVVFETDGVPNTSGTGTFTNGGPYNSYYANPGVGGGATFASAASQAVAIVDQIVALDSAANPGFSSTNTKALVYPCGFGHLFESSVPDTVTLKSQAMAFLLQVGQHGNTISASDTVNSPIITNGNGVTGPRFRVNFLITGTYQQRIDGLRLFFQGVMQAGVKVALIR